MRTWLFSRNVDLGVFLGSAVASVALLVFGAATGLLHADTPPILWLLAVVLVDVAHVWASAFRVYFDPVERARRPVLYVAVPIIGYVLGWALYSEGELVFWRSLAYLAVFHFVRQQWGWVARYRGLRGETQYKWIDMFAIYAATLYPLWHWHLTQPKRFHWFMDGDFFPVAQSLVLQRIGFVVWLLALGLYVARSAFKNPGKDIVVATTALCWYLGIVAFDSDYAFTVTNVLIHGVPYFAIVWFGAKERQPTNGNWAPAAIVFLGVLWVVAFGEEALWDKTIWHAEEHRAFFGSVWNVGSLRGMLVPLLALPQITHYVLDGFIWRRAPSS